MNQPPQQTQAPPQNAPPMSSGPPPMGSGSGPRPMARGSSNVAATVNVNEADCDEVNRILQPFMANYEAIEGSKKAGQDMLKKLNALCAMLLAHKVDAPVTDLLLAACQNVEEGNYVDVNGAIKTLTTQHWAKCKDWAAALKALVAFTQKQG